MQLLVMILGTGLSAYVVASRIERLLIRSCILPAIVGLILTHLNAIKILITRKSTIWNAIL